MMLSFFQNSWMWLAIQKGLLNNFNMVCKFLMEFLLKNLKKMAKSLKTWMLGNIYIIFTNIISLNVLEGNQW